MVHVLGLVCVLIGVDRLGLLLSLQRMHLV
jgi:hypothetical protein